MKHFLPLLALIATPIAVAAQDAAPQLSLEHRTLVRCSAAIAMVAQGQATAQEDALRYPDLRERGREFFVRATAQVMDEAGLDRTQIEAALATHAQDIWNNGTIDEVMPSCLALLPA